VDPILIWLFVLLFMLSAFFSWTELALMSMPDHKLKSLVKQKRLWSKALKKIKENSDRLLITILIWNNLVNVYTAALATTIAISMWEASGFPQAQAVWIATWIVTFFLLLFWEIIPKSFAIKNSTWISLMVAPIYRILMIVLYPIISIMEILIKLFSWKGNIEKITDEEIESFIDMWKHSGTLEQKEHKHIKNILDFNDTTVEEIMTPRVNIEALSSDLTVKDVLEFYLSHTHSRIPIYEKTIDKINYFITIRDILNKDDKIKIKDLDLPKVIKVPLNQPIDKLLENFQKSHKLISIAIDEYGWVAWLITLEDVIEEIFWEIRDETDKEIDEIKENSDGSLICESDVLIEDILEKFELELPDIWLNEKEFDWETLSYVITDIIKWFPTSWEIISFDIKNDDEKINSKLKFKVLDIKDHKIGKIEVKRS